MDKVDAMHGLAIKKFGTPVAVANVLAAVEADVKSGLDAAVSEGLAMANAQGMYMLTPKGQQALAAAYPEKFSAFRSDKALSTAYGQFERVNNDLKQLITEWQTMNVAGETVPNDHSDSDYDAKIIDRLGELHERAEPVLKALSKLLPRLGRYLERLDNALDKAEAGEINFVSGAKIDSYHTVWFELHEDLLRILDRKRDD